MAEINQIDSMASATISDSDLLVVYDASVQRTFSISRGELLRGVARDLPALARASVDVTLPIVTAASTAPLSFPVPGAAVGSSVSVSFDGGLPAGLVAMAHVSAADTVTVTLANVTGTDSVSAAKVARIVAWGLS